MNSSPRNPFPLIRDRLALFGVDQTVLGRSGLCRTLLDAAALAAMEGRGNEVDLRLERGGSCTFTFHGTLWPPRFVTEPPLDTLARRLTLADLEWGRSPANPHYRSVFSAFDDLALVNALSSWMEVTHRADANAWRQHFRDGAPEGPPRALPAHEVDTLPPRVTRIRFLPARAVFPHARFSRTHLSQHMVELAVLTAPVSYRLDDELERKQDRYRFERGLIDYTERLTASAEPLHAPWSFQGPSGTTRVQLVLQWSRRRRYVLHSWSNLYRVLQGAHVRGLREGLLQAFQSVRPRPLSAPPTRGLTVVMKLVHPSPLWQGNLKDTLGNPECRDAVRELLQEGLIPRLEAEPELVERILSQQAGAAP